MAQPIKTSDLFEDDGGLEKLLKTLVEIDKTYKSMIEGIKKEAKELEGALGGVNTKTEQGREATKKAVTVSEKLERQLEKYNEALDENSIKLAAAREATRLMNLQNKLQAKLAASLEGSYNKLSAQYSLNKLRLNQMSKEMRSATVEGKKLEKETAAIYEEMKRLQEVTGKHVLSVGDYGKALRDLPGPMGKWIGDLKSSRDGLRANIANLRGFTKGMGKVRIAIASTGIGLLVLAVGALYVAFTRLEPVMNDLDDTMAGINETIDELLKRIAIGGLAIARFFAGDVQGAALLAKLAITDLNKVAEKFNIGKNASEELRNIKKESAALAEQSAKTRLEINRQNLIAGDTTKGIKERKEATKKAFDLEQGILSKKESLLKREIAALSTLSKKKEEISQKNIELAEIQAESLGLQASMNKGVNAITKEGIDRANKQKEAVKDLVEEIENANAKLAGPAAVARLEFDRAIERIQELREEAKKLGQDLDFSNLELIEESVLLRALNNILGDPKNLDDSFEQLKQKLSRGFTELSKQDFVKPLTPGGLSKDIENGISDEYIKGIQSAADKIKSETNTFKEDIISDGLFPAIGFDLGIGEKAQEDIKTFYNFALKEALNFAKHRQQIAQQNIEAAQSEVEEAKTALQQELDARNANQANRVQTAQKELAEAKKREQQAIADKKKAAKQQLAIETLQQGQSLLTAAAKIWAQVGFPAALPAIATMFGSFALAKVRAAQLIKNKKEFAKGGYEELNYGGSHSSGNDIPLGNMADGTERRVEKGEGLAIFSKKRVRQYRGMIPQIVKAINNGQLESVLNINQRAAAKIPMFVNNFDTSKMEKHLIDIKQAAKNKGEQWFNNSEGKLVRIRGNVRTTYV